MIKINCELCGKSGELVKAIIEGVELNVCSGCAKFGKVIGALKRPQQKEIKKIIREAPHEEKAEMIVEDFAELIKRKREQIGLSQKDFANKANEKESTIHHIETGKFQPPLSMAKKFEKLLGIKLVEEYSEKHEKMKRSREEGFTLGDFIKIKK